MHFHDIAFVRSHLRVEKLVADGVDRAALPDRLRNIVDAHGFLTIFTHETCFNDPRTIRMLHDLLEACHVLGLRSS